MRKTIGKAPGVAVKEVIDTTIGTESGDISIGGCIVVATKGKPFEAMKTTGDTLVTNFGIPLHQKDEGMEGLRHVADATKACTYVNVVRVVNADTYRFPSVSFLLFSNSGKEWTEGEEYVAGEVVTKDEVQYICAYDNTATEDNAPDSEGNTDWLVYSGPVEYATHRYDEDIVVGEGNFITIYPIDGDTSESRFFRITDVDEENERATFMFYYLDDAGDEQELEEIEVSFDKDGKDDTGIANYVEDQFVRYSDYFRCDFMEGVTWEEILPILNDLKSTKVVSNDYYFEGGIAGDSPTESDYLTAVEVFTHEDAVRCNLLFAAGIYDYTVLKAMVEVAETRRIHFFYDVPPSYKAGLAMEWNKDAAIKSRYAQAFYCPYSAYDPWRESRCVWGASGAAAAAKATCYKITGVQDAPGIHYSLAGQKRGMLSRTSMQRLFQNDSTYDEEELVAYRLNPIVPCTTGGCYIGDDLTQVFRESYLRFGNTNSIEFQLAHEIHDFAKEYLFDPNKEAMYYLEIGIKAILDKYVLNGALVSPRYPERDGTEPYTLSITETAIDKLYIEYTFCPEGFARRIVAQPILVS